MTMLFGTLKNIRLPRSLTRFLRHYIGGLYNSVSEHHLLLLAGGLSFSVIICMLPMVLIVFAMLGRVFEQPSVVQEISSFVDKVIPYEDSADYIKSIITSRMDEFRVYKSIAGVAGLLGLLIASSGLFGSMRTILNSVYRVRSYRPGYVLRLRDMGLVVLVVAYFLLSITVLPTLGIIEKLGDKFEVLSGFKAGVLTKYAMQSASFLIILSAFYILYLFVPEQLVSRRALVSAAMAAILWKIAEYLFGYYITTVATVRRIYGAYALTIVVAFWIYYTSIVFVVAAQIGQLYHERRTAIQNRGERI